MAKIAYILLCHKDPAGIIAQANRLTAAGDCLSIHFDARASAADYRQIFEALKDNPAVVFARRRQKCGWGEWSLVEATLEALKAAVGAFPRATHFYMLSGDCMPIKSAEYAWAFVEREDVDYIESFDFFRSDWIRTGIREERLIYRHFFNERSQKKWFYRSLAWQQRLGLKRKVPADLAMQIGSQWWCLRRRSVESLLDFIARRRDVLRFFRRSWIPDESFFQTLIRHLVPDSEIRSRTLTFLIFTDYGMPVSFHNDHYALLLGQDYLFARKISPDALSLKQRLGELYTRRGQRFQISDEGRNLFRFVTGRGRIGRRYAPRFWENDASLGRERRLLMVTCRKWHVAKRLSARIRNVTGLHCVDYLFNEDQTALPDLGGIQTTLEKRTRHRRALVRMLYDYWQTDRMLFCIDPASVELMQDFYKDKAEVRLLEIECAFSDQDLIGHARRTGLAGHATAPEVMDQLLQTIRYDLAFESEQIRECDFPGYTRMSERQSEAANARALADFLDIPLGQALNIVSTSHLFTD